MDYFALLVMTATAMDCFAFARNDGNDWIASLSLAMTTTAKKGCLLFDRFPLNCFAGMTDE